MRTYSIEKRFGGSGNHMFSDTKTVEEKKTKRFDIQDVLLPGDCAVVEFPGLGEYLESLCYRDGSYAYESRLAGQDSAADLHGTPYAACATRLLGVGPKKETLDYIDGRKNGDGTFRGGYTRENELEGVYWCVLALKMGGREVPEESIGHVKSLRNEDGSYGLGDDADDDARLKRTGQALTILKLADVELSPDEREKTARYILERLDRDDGVGGLDACYGAVVSLNMLGRGITPELRGIVKEQIDAAAEPDSYEKRFKVMTIQSCIAGIPEENQLLKDEERESAALRRQPFPFRTHAPSFPGSAEEAYYALSLRKLRRDLRNF